MQYNAMDSPRELLLLDYPNINEKSIPDCIELTRLVDLIRCRKKMLGDLEWQLEEAQTDHDTEEKRTKEQALIIPAQDMPKLLSEKIGHENREEAAENLQHQGEQLSQARIDLEMLKGAVHPIRRCPTDILQCIFDWIVTTVEPVERHKPATVLSHVCYRWRSVAINIPKFWSYIEVSLKHAERIEWVWTHFVERIRNCPATIKIRDISDEDEAWKGMKKCRLDLIPNIDCLTFSLNSSDGAERLADGELFLPTGFIKTLRIEGIYGLFGGIPTVDLGRVLNRFPPLKRLGLREINFHNFTANVTFPSVVHLSLRRSNNVPLNILAKAFPSIQSVMFWSTKFRPYSGEAIVWPKLDKITAYSTEGIPWHTIKLPKITQLALPELRSPEGIIDRLPAYPSLWHLLVPKLVDCSSDIIKNASKVICIALPASEAVTLLQFSCLIVLRLVQKSSDDLSCELLEEIIRKHFLPSRQLTREEKQLAIDAGHPERLLKISVPKNADFELHWRESPLLPFSLEQSLAQELWMGSYQTYIFKWV